MTLGPPLEVSSLPSRSLAFNTLLNMAVRLTLVILLISGISYWHLMSQLAEDTRTQLLGYIAERGQREDTVFVLAQANHELLQREFLTQFAQRQDRGGPTPFSSQFFTWSDRTVRNAPETIDFEEFDTQHHPSAFVQQDVNLDRDFKTRMALSYDLVEQYGLGWQTTFLNTYISLPEGAVSVYIPGEQYGLAAPADYNIRSEEWAYLGDRAHNPERKTLWTGVYRDRVMEKWVVSAVTPIDDETGRHLGTIGHDLVLDDLIERAIDDRLEGTYNLLVRTDGQLIANPKMMDVIQAEGGQLTVQATDDEHLQRIFAFARSTSEPSSVIRNPIDREYLAIAKLSGPDWYLISVYPEGLLQTQALDNTRFLLGLGLASLLLEVLLLWLILLRKIKAPLQAVVEATRSVAEGNFSIELDTQRQDELGQLATSFMRMTQQLKTAFENLENRLIEQRRTEAESRKVKERLQLLVEYNPIGIIEWDLELKVVGWNPAAAAIFQYSFAEMQGRDGLDIVPESDRDKVREMMAALLDETGGQQHVNQNLRRDRTIVTCEWLNTPLRDSDDRIIGLFSMVQDISDRKRSQEAIARKSEELEAALVDLKAAQIQMVQTEKMSALGNLVAGVAHEINNPTGFLKGNIHPAQVYVQDLLGLIDLLLQKSPHDDLEIQDEIEAIDLEFVREDLPKLLESMELGVDRIREISNSLRTFSRQDRDEKTTFNLHDGLDSTLLILKHRTKANEQRPAIKIIKNYGEIPEIYCFPGQLNQVFINLLANSIDAFDDANQGKSFAEIQSNPNCITIATQQLDDRQIQVRIQDNGCGMTSDVQSRIFEQGFTTKEVGKGTGLGMAIVSEIITDKHDGTIVCTSEAGCGTTFTLTLPIHYF